MKNLLIVLCLGLLLTSCSKDHSEALQVDEKELLEFEFAYEADEAVSDFQLVSSENGSTWSTRAIVVPQEGITSYKIPLSVNGEKTQWRVVANHANGQKTYSTTLLTR